MNQHLCISKLHTQQTLKWIVSTHNTELPTLLDSAESSLKINQSFQIWKSLWDGQFSPIMLNVVLNIFPIDLQNLLNCKMQMLAALTTQVHRNWKLHFKGSLVTSNVKVLQTFEHFKDSVYKLFSCKSPCKTFYILLKTSKFLVYNCSNVTPHVKSTFLNFEGSLINCSLVTPFVKVLLTCLWDSLVVNGSYQDLQSTSLCSVLIKQGAVSPLCGVVVRATDKVHLGGAKLGTLLKCLFHVSCIRRDSTRDGEVFNCVEVVKWIVCQ